MEFKDLVKLGQTLASATPSAPVAYSFGQENFSYANLRDTFAKEVSDMVGDYYKYEKNKVQYFQLMAEIITDYLPKKVMEQFGTFAETKVYAQGDKAIFVQKITEASKKRAKSFVSRVGLDGIYEVFKLDGAKFEVQTAAYGAACQVTLEEVLDNRMDLPTMLDIMMEGLNDQVYLEIQKSLIAAATSLDSKFKTTGAGFVEADFDALLAKADSLGHATIYCTMDFATKMVPATGWISNEMKNTRWNNGYLGNYKGHQVIVLDQSYTDDFSKKIVNSEYVYMIPAGVEKPVKIAFEGTAIVREYENKDASKEIQIYEKFGVASTVRNNICVYIDSSLIGK